MLTPYYIWSYLRIAEDSSFAGNVGGVLIESGDESQGGKLRQSCSSINFSLY